LIILPSQPPSQKEDNEDEYGIATQVHGERNEVTWSIPGEKDLGPDCVTGRPADKVHGHSDSFLGLATDVAREH
jgi:hypothetical protein